MNDASDLWQLIFNEKDAAIRESAIFVIGGVLGFLVSRFTFSKSEKAAHKQKIYENTIGHQRSIEERYKDFTSALSEYISSDTSHLDNFVKVSRSGDLYFSELKIVANACLGSNIEKSARDQIFVPKII